MYCVGISTKATAIVSSILASRRWIELKQPSGEKTEVIEQLNTRYLIPNQRS